MTEFFVSNALSYSPNAAVVVTGVLPDSTKQAADQASADFSEEGPGTAADWQPDESALLPSFGVERARELILWLINLELRLPPYSEASPA